MRISRARLFSLFLYEVGTLLFSLVLFFALHSLRDAMAYVLVAAPLYMLSSLLFTLLALHSSS